MQNNNSKLKSDIRTIQERDAVLLGIDEFINGLYQTKSDSYTKLPDLLKKEVQRQKISLRSPEATRDFLEKKREELAGLPTMSLRLAFFPPEKLLRRLASWVKINAGADVILDISIDESLLAGAVVAFGGRYKDYSLRKKLEEAFK